MHYIIVFTLMITFNAIGVTYLFKEIQLLNQQADDDRAEVDETTLHNSNLWLGIFTIGTLVIALGIGFLI